MGRLKFAECENCKDWKGVFSGCFNKCPKPIDALREWNEYKDLEEQGKLLKLPCRLGEIVYRIFVQRDNFDGMKYSIVTASAFRLDMLNDIGKTVFLTKAEAEAVLKEMENKHE